MGVGGYTGAGVIGTTALPSNNTVISVSVTTGTNNSGVLYAFCNLNTANETAAITGATLVQRLLSGSNTSSDIECLVAYEQGATAGVFTATETRTTSGSMGGVGMELLS